MTEGRTQQETLQELSDEWKHRDDKPKQQAAKTGRGRRSKAAAAKTESPPAASTAEVSKASNKEDADTA